MHHDDLMFTLALCGAMLAAFLGAIGVACYVDWRHEQRARRKR